MSYKPPLNFLSRPTFSSRIIQYSVSQPTPFRSSAALFSNVASHSANGAHKHTNYTRFSHPTLQVNKFAFLARLFQNAAPPTPSPAKILICLSLNSLLNPLPLLSRSNLSQFLRLLLTFSSFIFRFALIFSISSSRFLIRSSTSRL